jgi:tRNA threonylcarbamoyladenosine biosynthesis protein TsaE
MSCREAVFLTASAEETEDVGFNIGKALKKGDCVALMACLGAGKTVLTRGIARSRSISGTITSPTYTIINEYVSPAGEWFFHVDAYRLGGAADFEDIGGVEIFDKGLCVIEWSERILPLLPKEAICVTIKIQDDGKREITIRKKNDDCEHIA